MLEEPDWTTTGAFTVAQGVARGLTVGRLRNRAFARPHHGVRVSAGALPADDVFAACAHLHAVIPTAAVFSHTTAARLWGFPLPAGLHGDLHVLMRATRGVRRPGVIGWVSTQPIHAVIARRMPTLNPADTWVSLATMTAERGGLVSDEWLVAIGDFLISGRRTLRGRHRPLSTKDELRAAVRRHGSRRSAVRLARALDLLRSPVDSPPETFVRLTLVGAGLPEPAVQPTVMTTAGVRHPDLGYLKERVLIEYLGDVHRTDPRTWRADLTRVQLLEDAGYRVILAGADELLPRSRPAFAARVRRALGAAREDAEG